MSGTKVKTLFKNLKTQNESSLETFQELPITFRDMSSTSPAPLDVYVSEDAAFIKMPSAGDSAESSNWTANPATADSTVRVILDDNTATPGAAIKAATAANSAYVSVDSSTATGDVVASIGTSGSSGVATVLASGSDIYITASTSSVGQQTRVLLEGADNKVSVSGSLDVNVEDHGGAPADMFRVNSETASGTLTPILSVQSAIGGTVALSNTTISGDTALINPSTALNIVSPSIGLTGDVTINAQNQVKIELENDGTEQEVFKLDIAGNSPRSIISAHTDGGGSDVSTLTLYPNQLRMYGDIISTVQTYSAGSTASLVAGGTGSEAKVEGSIVSLTATNLNVTADNSTVSGLVDLNAVVRSNSQFEFTGSSQILIENSRVELESGSAATHYVLGIPSSGGQVKRKLSSDINQFFSGTHIYLSRTVIPLGSSVVLSGSEVSVSDAANSNNCCGIVCKVKEWDLNDTVCSTGDIEEPVGDLYVVWVTSVGDSVHRDCQGFNVCNEGGAVQPGDLLVTSNTPGYLMRQIDDVIRASTVGKAMESVVFDENGQATGVYGYLYCG